MLRSLNLMQPDLSWHVPNLQRAPSPRPHLYRTLRRPLRLSLRHPERVHARPSPIKTDEFSDDLIAA